MQQVPVPAQEVKKPWLSGRRRSIVGVAFIILPWITLVGVIVLYAISEFVIASVLSAQQVQAQEFEPISADEFFNDERFRTGIAPEIPIEDYPVGAWEGFDTFGDASGLMMEEAELGPANSAAIIGSLIRIILSLIGLVSMLMIPIGGVIGVYLLVTNKE